VGIGTSSPNTKLQVYKAATSAFTGTSSGALLLTDSSNTLNYFTSIDFNTTNGPSVPYARIGMSYTSGGSTLSFGTSNSYASGITNTAMTIDPSGNLLVGNTTSLVGSGGSIQAMGPSTSRGYLSLGRTTAATSGVCGSLLGYNGTNSITSIDFQSNGANNSGLIQTYTWSAGSPVQGPYVTTGGTSWTTASDETLKDIIAPIEEATFKLSGLRTVFGKYKTDHDDVRRIFLIAQDVQAVLPEAVSTDGNGKLGLNYQDLVPVLVKAIQEQQALITQLTDRIAALEAK
jgi:hypothetical protein